jgi:predicted DNA-binding transcriptional regulator AlpA
MQKESSLVSILESLKYFDDLPSLAHVRQPTVEALFSCSASTLRRLVRNGSIPKPHKLSRRISVWRVDELRASIEEMTK